MRTNLRLVANNLERVRGRRHDGVALRRLALRLTGHLRAGNSSFAHAIATIEALSPIEMGVVSTWMARAGIPETQILHVMAGNLDTFRKSAASLSA